MALKRQGTRIIAVDSEISARYEAFDSSVTIRKTCTMPLVNHKALAGTPLRFCRTSQAGITPPPAGVNSDSAASSVHPRKPPPTETMSLR